MRFGSRVGQYFEVRKGLRQRYIMSPWFFNIFFERVIRLVNEKATGRGVVLGDDNGREREIKQVFNADDTVLVAKTKYHPQHIVNEHERACDRKGLKINVGKCQWLKRIRGGVVGK